MDLAANVSKESVYQLLESLQQKGVRLYLDGDNLKFNAPKGVLQGELLGQLRQYKQDVMEIMALEQEAKSQLEQPIPSEVKESSNQDDVDNGYPLTFAQRRFWFLDRLAGGNSPIYNMLPIALRLDGNISVEAIQKSIQFIVKRHPFLASRFDIRNGEPRQWPIQEAVPEVEVFDYSSQSTTPDLIEEEILKQGERPFDLQKGEALLRIALLKLQEQSHILVLTVHHIVADGWSLGILVDEFSQCYQAFSSGKEPRLPLLDIHYGDFSKWEQKRLTRKRIDHDLQYWKQVLQDVPSFLELPADFSRPSRQTYQGQTATFVLPSNAYSALKSICVKAGVTPFMFLLSLFSTLLHRYSGADDFVIGTPRSVRKHTQTEPVVGLFLNTLPIRVSFQPADSFLDLLQRIKTRSLGAFEYDEIPFDELLQALQIPRDLDRTPLFQVLFALQNTPVEEIVLDNLTISPVETRNSKAPFDLVLSMEDVEQGLEGRFRYNTDLFSHETINRLADHFLHLTEQVIADIKKSISSYSLLTPSEKAELERKNRDLRFYPVDEPLHRRFERMVEVHADSIAVDDGEVSLNYRELNAYSNQIAHQLLKMGVKTGDRIGLCMNRSVGLIATIHAIHKCGAAYVPLDPAYPSDRLEYMADDSGLAIVVTDQKSRASVPTRVHHILDVETISSGLPPNLDSVQKHDIHSSTQSESQKSEIQSNPDLEVSPDQIAYVIYTSGSTGKPKGVEVTHKNVMRLFHSCEGLYDFSHQDIWSLFHSYSFDFSVWEIWGAHLYGGKLRIIPYSVSRNPEEFYQLCVDEGITVLNQTPSAFKQFMEVDRRNQKGNLALRWVIFGGEALDMGSLREWTDRRGFEQPTLVNMYGITETTVHVTYHKITELDVRKGGSTIGHPLPDLLVELLDPQGNPVPVGVPGEIWVGGDGVANGYLNREELTRQRFVKRPDLSGQERMFYRSGDLAKWKQNGTLNYMGRMDQQVKIRGFRIELGEIESQILRYEAVSSTVVTVLDGASGPELVAYVVLREQKSLDQSALRKFLLEVLPDYMVPGAFVVLDEIPLTQNGKVNKKALPAPDRSDRITSRDFRPPTTPLEILIADLWKEVLGISEISSTDNFFELGGDSIKGAIFSNRMQEVIGEIFFVVALFEAPSIEELTEYMKVHYPDAVRRIDASLIGEREAIAPITSQDWKKFRSEITPLSDFPAIHAKPKNKPAVFVLAPPRSGTTLLRVLLGGHSKLFSPPELELMPFNTLKERNEICSGRDAFWLEGTLRAVMEIHGASPEEAKARMAEFEHAGLSVMEFYATMQSWLNDRILVDKSPSYVLHTSILDRIEQTFDGAMYIHLHRHPLGMIHSFEEAKLHQIFFRYPYHVTPRQLAELIWLESHSNILSFLEHIPAERQIQIGFEELTQQPESHVKDLTRFLGLKFEKEMLRLYDEQQSKRRMTDGLYKESTMLGDVKFHTHKSINSQVAERWKASYSENFLGKPTLDMTTLLGYSVQEIEEAFKKDNEKGVDPISAEVKERTHTPIETSQKSNQEKAKSKDITISKTHNADTPLKEYPLSQSQQRLWILDQIEGVQAVYNMPVALWLEGSVSPVALEKACKKLVDRHEVLRSRFVSKDGEPKSVIKDTFNPFATINLSHIPASKREELALDIAKKEASRPFQLSRDPLFRATWIRLNENRSLFVLVMHHIVSDGWSMGIISRELEALYTNSSHPHALPIQYGDFALRERKFIESEAYQKQLTYWKNQLVHLPPRLELPTDRPRPAQLTYRGETLNFQLGKTTSQQLRKFAEQENSSLYMLFLAGFSLLLHRYTGEETIVVGSPSANRSRKEIEGLIGFFVNTLVLKIQPTSDDTFRTLLKKTRKTALEAYKNQDVTFEKLVGELHPVRDMSYTPLFQVMLAMQNTPLSLPTFGGAISVPATLSNPVSKFDLTLTVADHEEEIGLQLEYSSELFDRWRMKQLVEQLEILLLSAINETDSRISQLPLLSPERTEAIFKQLKGPEKQWDAELIHQQIEKIATQNADRPAVQGVDGSLTYAQLTKKANQLAHYLIHKGVKSGDRVSVILTRKTDLIIALLAVLKTGACYIPIDPEFPDERIRIIIEDSGADFTISEQSLSTQFNSSTRINIDSERDEWQKESDHTPDVDCSPTDLIYIIFTSGSTGRPKGVMLSHRSVSNFARSMVDQTGLSKNDRFLATTTISFDIAVLEIWSSLIAGAEVVLADEQDIKDGSRLIQQIQNQQITFMQGTPVTWKMLLLAGWNGASQLTAFSGGEALQKSLARELMPKVNTLWNLYGPTETAVYSATARVNEYVGIDSAEKTAKGITQEIGISDTESSDDGIVPIGKPIHNTTLYIVDSNLQPVPEGVPGELLIGGIGVANGYYNREELTSEKFIPDPFFRPESGHLSDPVLYRTGDLVCLRETGTIDFIGRIDNQIKLRGYRIELGEIETQLKRHKLIKDAVVEVIGQGDSRNIAAFIRLKEEVSDLESIEVTDNGSYPDQNSFTPDPIVTDKQINDPEIFQTKLLNPTVKSEIQATLQKSLPDYMIPAFYFSVSSYPLTPNGKLDRKALRSTKEFISENEESANPRDSIELYLKSLWEELLQRSNIQLNDNFFDLGGHSLIAVRLMANLKVKYQIDLPITILFKGGTIQELAKFIRTNSELYGWNEPVKLKVGQTNGPTLYMSAGAGGNVLYLNSLATHLPNSVTALGFQPKGLDGKTSPATSLQEIAKEYIQQMEIPSNDEPVYLLGHSFGGYVVYEIAKQLTQSGHSLGKVILVDTPAPNWFEPTGKEWSDAKWMNQITSIAAHQYGISIGLTEQDFENCSSLIEMTEILNDQLIKAGVFPESMSPSFLQGFVQVYKSNLMMDYKPDSQPVNLDLVLIRSADLQPEQLSDQRAAEFRSIEDFGWSKWATGTVQVLEVPGDHLTMLTDSHLQQWSPQLKALFN